MKSNRLQHSVRIALLAMERLRFEVFGYGSYAAFANRMKQITLGRTSSPHQPPSLAAGQHRN